MALQNSRDSDRPVLVFDLDGELFAVDAGVVRETVWLPELTPIEEAPGWIAGIFSYSTVFLAGLLIAAFVSIPIVNLATPLFAMALMVHMHKRLSGRVELIEPRRA